VVVVISDTSPVRALNYLGLIDILGTLFDKVIVPPAVLHELSFPPSRIKSVEISAYDFFEILAPHDEARVQSFLRLLDPGESEALALALEIGPEAVLLDDRAARAVATEHEIPILGTLGVLLHAKVRGRIESVGPLIETLTRDLDFYVSDTLRADILRSAGE
jgi:uncharacterized protein